MASASNDIKRNHPGREIPFSGGIFTDMLVTENPCEDLENLLPGMGMNKGLEPRDGCDLVLALTTEDTDGYVIIEVTLDDVARTKLICVMSSVDYQIEHITDHTDQEGRKSIAPLGGGELPITPEPEPEPTYNNALYFENATMTSPGEELIFLTVKHRGLGGTASWVAYLMEVIDDYSDVFTSDIIAQGTVTSGIEEDGTIYFEVPVFDPENTGGQWVDVYLFNPVGGETFLENPTSCRVTVMGND